MLSRCRRLSRLFPLVRAFSTTLQQEQQQVAERLWMRGVPYQLTRPIEYKKGVYVVFEQDLKGIRQMPHEIKETALKNTLGVATLGLLSYIHPILSLPIPLFVLNMFIRSLRYMLVAVHKIELLEGGQKVRLTKKIGGKLEVPIANIYKKEKETTLLNTYMEPYLFPIEIRQQDNSTRTYYIYGRNFEPIHNGEVFRAILNGKPILIPPSSAVPTETSKI